MTAIDVSTTEQPTDTPEQGAFRAEVQAFLAANAQPRRDVSPWALNFHTDPAEAQAEFDQGVAWQRTLSEHGLAGLTYPVEYGGRGGTAWHEQIYREEAVKYDVSSGFIAATMAMLLPTLMRFGTEEQKSHYIARMLSGEYSFCQLFSEPGAGSDLASLGCRAVRDGDDFIVTGQKVWNSSAQYCNHGFLLVRTNPDVPKHQGITFLLVDMDWEGIEVRPLVQPTGAQHFNEVFLSEVRVPVSRVLGEIDGGWAPARTVLSNESAFIGGGQGDSTVTKLATLARERGLEQDPNIRQALAQAHTRERLLDLMGQRILTAVRNRQVPPMDPSILKLFVAQNKVETGNLAMALLGPAALTSDEDRPQWAQAELLGRFGISIGGGTNEVQRNNLAERALGLPRDIRNDRDVAWRDIPRS